MSDSPTVRVLTLNVWKREGPWDRRGNSCERGSNDNSRT
jgi:hypothetical protein